MLLVYTMRGVKTLLFYFLVLRSKFEQESKFTQLEFTFLVIQHLKITLNFWLTPFAINVNIQLLTKYVTFN